MDNNFYKLNKILDKNKDSSTHKSQYLAIPEEFNLSFNQIKKEAYKFNSQEDIEIIEQICSSLETLKKLPFVWTPQENFYLNKCNSLELKIKYLIYRYKFKIYPEKKILSSFPIHILIEPTSICNLRCVMCYQVDKKFTGDDVKKNSNLKMMGKMSFELFKKIIDESEKEGANAISLGSRGEPMLNNHFLNMIEYLKKKKFFDIKINSNGSALTEKICHAILDSNVNILVISCDGENSELYEKIRVGGNFKRLIKNINLLTSIRNKFYKNSKLEIRISGVYFHPEQDEKKFYEFWKDKVDTVSFVKFQNRWDTYNNPIQDKNSPCEFLWEKLYVWWDGTTNPCDEDYMSLLSPGNLNNKSIKSLWNSEKLNNLRKMHLKNKRVKKKPCDRCGV